ncbi:MAG: DUF721 domain-containing protein [Saprospiraceae bacterium]
MKKYEQSLGDVLKDMLNDSGKMKHKLFQTKVRTAWGKLMGTTIAAYTSDIKLRDNKLYLTINSAPLRQELAYSKEKIINILNEELGEMYIKEVILR